MARMAVIVLILGVCLPEILLARMVLKAGEIDSGKVRVGVFAEVVYGKGKRDPASGQWEKLARVSGYIKAVDAESLTLALRQGLGKKRIAFAYIQKLLLAKSSREMGRLKDTLRRWKRPVSILQPSEVQRSGIAGVVLEAGEIDSGKVRVGVFAAVVYGKGARDPVSGQWEKLARVSGYIKAVDAESLTLALRQGLGKKRIAFAHIQKLLLAKSSREVGRLKAESSGVVLEAGEIDSSKVRVGAFAEVVYGKGARDPVSGEWEKLETASGYIKAVDAEHLTLGRGLWKERIAFARIQRLILAASGREMERLKRATGVESPLWSTDGGRLAAKLGAGAGAGVAAGFAAAGLVFVLAGAELPEEEGPGLALVGGMALSGWIAYLIGVPVGVSRVDPHDRFMASLAGSVIGGGVGYHMTRQQDDIGPSVLIWPLVGAVTMSEIFRDPPEARRLSVGLAPSPKGSVSALATLRF